MLAVKRLLRIPDNAGIVLARFGPLAVAPRNGASGAFLLGDLATLSHQLRKHRWWERAVTECVWVWDWGLTLALVGVLDFGLGLLYNWIFTLSVIVLLILALKLGVLCVLWCGLALKNVLAVSYLGWLWGH